MNEDPGKEAPQGEPRPDSTPREPRPADEPDAPRSAWEEPRPPPAGEAPRTEAGPDAPPSGDARPIRPNLTSKATWLRLVFIVLFAIVYGIVELVLTAVVVIQFLFTLLTGAPNERLRELGQSLARYVYQIIRFLTYNTELRPFPIDLDWPDGRQNEP